MQSSRRASAAPEHGVDLRTQHGFTKSDSAVRRKRRNTWVPRSIAEPHPHFRVLCRYVMEQSCLGEGRRPGSPAIPAIQVGDRGAETPVQGTAAVAVFSADLELIANVRSWMAQEGHSVSVFSSVDAEGVDADEEERDPAPRTRRVAVHSKSEGTERMEDLEEDDSYWEDDSDASEARASRPILQSPSASFFAYLALGGSQVHWREAAASFACAVVDDCVCDGDAHDLIVELIAANPLMRILLVTENKSETYITTCIDSGACDYFNKLPDDSSRPSSASITQSSEFSGAESEDGYFVIETSKRFPGLSLRLKILLASTQQSRARRKEQEFMRTAKLLISSVEATCYGIQIFDNNGLVQYANLHLSELLNRTRFECIGEPFVSFLASKFEAEDFLRLAWPTLRGGGSWRGEMAFVCKDGSEVTLTLAISSFEYENEMYFMAISWDASRMLQREEALRMDAQRASEVARFKSSMLYSTSHDIRNLMTGVIGVLDVVQMKDSSAKEHLGIMEIYSKQILDLTNDLLELSRLEASAMKIELEDVQFGHLVENSVEMFAEAAAHQNCTLYSYVDPKVPDWLVCDPHRCSQVLNNLIGNATKFTKDGSISVRATVGPHVECTDAMPLPFGPHEAEAGLTASQESLRSKFSAATEDVLVEITDTGIGIKQEHISKLFTPFSRTHSKELNVMGTGLGLVICKSITRLLGGTMGVKSEFGKGSTFWVRIPLLPSRITTQRDVSFLRGCRILCLAEHEPTRRNVAHYLGHFKAECKQVAIDGAYEFARVEGNVSAATNLAVVQHSSVALIASHVKALRVLKPTMPVIVALAGRATDDSALQQLRNSRGVSLTSWPLRFSKVMELLRAAMEKTKQTTSVKLTENTPTLAWPANVSPSVLVVDDSRINRKVAVMLLQKLGCRVNTCESGVDAVELVTRILSRSRRGSVITEVTDTVAKHKLFDVIFMDIHMPVMSGLETTRALRRLEEQYGRRRQVVLGMTGDLHEGTHEECVQHGMDGVLQKPVKMNMLRVALQEHVIVQKARSSGAGRGFRRVDGSGGGAVRSSSEPSRDSDNEGSASPTRPRPPVVAADGVAPQ